MVVVLALEVIPNALKAPVISEARNINPHIARAREPLHLLVGLLEAVMQPLQDERLSLIGRVDR